MLTITCIDLISNDTIHNDIYNNLKVVIKTYSKSNNQNSVAACHIVIDMDIVSRPTHYINCGRHNRKKNHSTRIVYVVSVYDQSITSSLDF